MGIILEGGVFGCIVTGEGKLDPEIPCTIRVHGEAALKSGVCLVSITREHQREYRESERLKRNSTGDRKRREFVDSANFQAILMILIVKMQISAV